MPFKTSAKRLLQQSGAFPIARSLYRRINPRVRADRKADRDLYSTLIKPGHLVFDVGVNLGQKSEVFLDCGARVIGVEPNPLCLPTLHHLFGSDPDFTLIPKALASTEGKMTLHFAGTSSTASLRPDWQWVGIEGTPETAEVDVTTLDNLIATHGVPNFCKIDVEGFEYEVLKGLSRPIPIVTFEFHSDEPEQLEGCLNLLRGIADLQINAIPMNGLEFTFREWASPNSLDFKALPPKGDIFVRMI